MHKFLHAIVGLVLGATLAFAPTNTNTALAGPTAAPLTEAREPSECLGMFDVWTNSSTGNTFVSYRGSALPFTGSGTLKIWVGSVKWGNWTVSSSAGYETKNLGKYANKWVTLELWKGTFMYCEGLYDSD